MAAASMGWVGGILVGVLACLGGVVGTYFSVKNTNGPRERAFIVKCAVVGWIAMGVFLALMFSLPDPYGQLLWIPYGIALSLGIRHCNRRQNTIRESERGE